MVFKPRFFLDLGGGDGQGKPAVVAPVKEKPAKEAKAAKTGKEARDATKAGPSAAASPVAAATPAAAAAPVAEAGAAPVLTTAEAIAAELAEAQANRPAPSVVTFAPECLLPGSAMPRRRRYAGANLAPFKAMAKGMMRG
jgi:hypothetical protein